MDKKQKQMNPILWFLFAIIIPFIIAISLSIIVLNVAGFNVTDWMKKSAHNIPFISNFVQTEEEISLESKIDRLEKELSEKHKEINELQQMNEDLEFIIQQKDNDITKLKEDLEEKETIEEDEVGEGSKQETLQDLSASFAEMDKQEAAHILTELDENISITLLNYLPKEKRAEILGSMNPETAADLTQTYVEYYTQD